jgi:Na+/proline symporter
MFKNVLTWQWILLVTSSVILFLVSPFIKNRKGFFSGVSKKDKAPGFLLLTTSLFISWIFAKSITNAANLGLSFGIVGGLSYAMYYFSFLVAGVVIYYMRTKGGFTSLHQFLNTRFGRPAIIIFTVLIGIRLINEVWSNTAVIGSYFGENGSLSYNMAVIVFTVLTLAYAMKGGLRSSIFTDLIQTILFAVLLAVVLVIVIPSHGSVKEILTSGQWKMSMGLNLFFVAMIQVFSYPFHDPVLTDRGFIATPKTTLKSYITATIAGFIAITLFSIVGVYGQKLGVSGQAAVEVAKTFNLVMLLLMNFIMITSAASTLDSTFSSVSKLAVIDIQAGKEKPVEDEQPGIDRSVLKGRVIMAIVALAGTIPVMFSPSILSATTISGTMVLGLAPVFVLWKFKAPPISFYLAVGIGVVCGILLATNLFPESMTFTTGKYNKLLAVNIYGTILVFAAYLIPMAIAKLTSVKTAGEAV